jgi:hypothetical protein
MNSIIDNLEQNKNITDFLKKSPSYKTCMKELLLKKNNKNTCSKKCRYKTMYYIIEYEGEHIILSRPILYRQTHKECKLCDKSVSDYNCSFCYECALKDTPDYEIYHRSCM